MKIKNKKRDLRVGSDKIVNTKSDSRLLNELAVRTSYYSSFTDLYLPDPDIVLEKLGIGLEAYRDLLSDSHVGACIESRKAGVKSLNWEIVPGNSQDTSELITKIFNKLKIDTIINEVLNTPLFGYQPIEITWATENGFIIPVKVQAKPPEWFKFDNNNELKFVSESDTEIELPPGKFLVATHDASYINPYGSKILSKCYWPVTFKKGGLKFWAMFIERFSGAFAIGKYPRGAQTSEIDDLASMLENLIQSAVAAIPDDSSVEILEAGGKGASSDIYKTYCDFFNSEISKAIIGQTLTTEVGSAGSFAASKTHAGIRKEIINSDARLVTDTLNQLIDLICQFNFISSNSTLPRFNFWSDEDVDIDHAQRDATLLNTGGFRFTKNYWKKAYGFEDDDIEITEHSQNTSSAMFSKKPTFLLPKDEVDNLIDSMTVEDIENEMNGILKPAIEAIEDAGDYNKAMEKLIESHDDMTSDELAEMLEKAMFLAELYGQLKGKENK